MDAINTVGARAPQATGAWSDFTHELAKALGRLGEHRYFALHVKGSARYVEFTVGAQGAMRVESVSNAWLPESQRLTEAESREMVALGWIAPNLKPGQSAKHLTGSPNYYVDARPPVSFERVAELATKTLASIHKAARPEDLEVRFGNASDVMDWMKTLLVGHVPHAAGSWDEFTHKLAVGLGQLEAHKYFALHVKGTARYVEFTCGEKGAMRVLSVSNAWLPEEQRMTDAECREMAALGWIAPNLLPGRSSKHLTGSPNYYVDAPAPVAFDRIATLATKTLASIHKAAGPANLEVRFGNATDVMEWMRG